MESRRAVGSLVARVGLTGQLLGQIFLTPMAAFALTYLLVFTAQGGDFRLSIEVDMIPWIGMASLFYGMLALLLALGMGGFTPLRVIESGGWRLALGLTRHQGSSAHRFSARQKYATSAHGRLSLLVHERFEAGHALWTIRGSLVLLAIPFQVLLATIPLSLVLMFPEGVVHQNRQLELALLLYGMCLYVSIRVFPSFARRYITLASLGRKFLGNTLRISWAFPIFLLWSMGQLSTYIVQRALGEDIALNIAFEKQLFESLISAGSSPETSFLNLLTALAVMPMAAFTTLAVLGGGAGTPPTWMKPGKKGAVDDTQEQLDMLSSGIDRLAADVNQSKATRPVSSYTPAVVQHVMVPVPAQQPAMPQPEPSPSTVDDLDFDALANRVARESAPDVSSPTSYNEPVIRGFDLESSEDA
ncbi:MAG: hypothetical protein L7R83_01560 [Candidatus Poseidonia sp.]|nr:hypothetical protein [Poseidonia sp.]